MPAPPASAKTITLAMSSKKHLGVRHVVSIQKEKGPSGSNVRATLNYLAKKVGLVVDEPSEPTATASGGKAPLSSQVWSPRTPPPTWQEHLDEDAQQHFKVVFPNLCNFEDRCDAPELPCIHPAQADERARLVDWVVRRHQDYELTDLTLFLAIRILDESLAIRWVSPQEMRKLGAASLLLASKFEDEMYPDHDSLATLSDKHFIAEELHPAEVRLLQQIGFRLHGPTVGHHLSWFVKLCNGNDAGSGVVQVAEEQLALALYIAELGLYCAELSHWKPTQHASAAVFLSNVLMSRPSWPRAFEGFAVGQQETRREAARSVAAELLRVLGRSAPGQAVYDKHEELSGTASQAIRYAEMSMGPSWRPCDVKASPCNIS